MEKILKTQAKGIFMTTTTLGSNGTRNISNKTMYWAIAAIIVIAFLVFFAVRPGSVNNTAPTDVNSGTYYNATPPAETAPTPAERTPADADSGTLNPTNPASGNQGADRPDNLNRRE